MTTDDLFAPFGLAVFEQLSSGLFQAVGPLPGWFQPSARNLSEGPVDLAGKFPVLELFLPEFTAACNAGTPEHLKSDIWTELAPEGDELYLQASAAMAGGRRFIAIGSLPAALYTYQQMAHDIDLEKEKVERLSRELEVKRREAERATQVKSDFLSTMSHEIRTPLNAIIGMADILATTSLTGDQQKCVEISQRNGVALLNLINDLLDLAKIEARRVELEAVEMDLTEVLAGAMEVVAARIAAKGLCLRKTIGPNVPRYLVGDPNRLRAVIVNLLGNALKFTAAGGIDVRVEPDPESADPGSLRFAITDTGIGIPNDKKGLLFESFTQADSSTTRKYGGTGLGLSISKQLVELMGGRIWVESQAGAGSTFFFTARLQVQTDQSERVAQTAEASGELLKKLPAGLRILLVDDSEDNRFLILSYLKETECEIDTAENGQVGVEMFRSNRYDAVLMDVEMPVMDGYAAVREIKSFETKMGAAPAPVFAMTAHAFADAAAKGVEAGFTGILTKPIRKAVLFGALAGLGCVADSRSGPAPQSPARIRMPEGLEDVVPGYLERRRAEVAVYRRNLASADLDAIRSLAHKMKGTGTGYGFPRLTEFGAVLEEDARGSDTASLQEHLDEFARYVESIELEQ